MQGDESRTLRSRHSTLVDRLDASKEEPPAASRSMVVRTTTKTTYPTTANVYYACLPVDVGGIEDEGQSGTLSAGTGFIYALNLGSTIPASGKDLVVESVGGRWCFRYDG
jgi:hypothetical protein